MDNKDFLPQTPEKSQLESGVNMALKNLQEKVRTGTKPDQREAAHALLESLHTLPDQFRSIQMRIRLDTRDERIEKYREWLSGIGVQPLDKEAMLYDLQILTPKKTPMGGVTATHGSQVRERYFSVGEIGTIKQDFGYDPETKDDTTTFLVNPANIGALSVDQSFGKYWLFPRQIEDIKLSTEIPNYLRQEQKSFVDKFYSTQ